MDSRYRRHPIAAPRVLATVMLLFMAIMMLFGSYAAANDLTPITELGKLIKDQTVDKGGRLTYTASVAALMPDIPEEDVFTVMMTPLSGDADLCVTTNDKPLPAKFDKDACDWHSATGHGDSVSVPRNDEKWPTGENARFNIGVYGRTPSNFMLNAWTMGTHIKLEPGIPQNAFAPRGKYIYLKFKLPKGKGDFHIGVTPQSGDPDLYASVELDKPTKEFCTSENCWMSSRYSYDVILIKDTDEKFRPEGEYNIGVYGWTDTTFNVHATPKEDYTVLPEGYPISDSIERGEYRYYKFWMTENEIRQTWTVDPITQGSDPDIYVRMQRDEDDKGEGEDKPSKEPGKYDWRSSGIYQDSVIIEKAKGGKWYYTAVYGYGKLNSYRIVTSTEHSSIVLNDGSMQTVVAPAAGSFYFKYHHGDDLSAVTFTASGISTAADIDMYYSSEISNPGKDKNDRVGDKTGSRSVMYFPTPARIGTYYLTVDVDRPCNFTMVAATNQTATVLQDNVMSFFNHAPATYYRYFVYDHEDLDTDLTVSVDPWLGGEVDLYISNTTARPTKEDAEWKSENYKQDTIVIHSEELKKMKEHRFYIGVYAVFDSFFSIIAYSASANLELEDGVPVTGIVPRAGSRFYKFRVHNNAAITISLRVTAANADADIYADFNTEKPSPSDHTWKGTSLGDDVIFIEEFDGERHPWLYIGVRGIFGPEDEAPFQLEVKQNYQIMRPNWGQLIQFTPKSKSVHFKALVNGHVDFVVLSTTLLNGRTKMYVKTDDSEEATPENADFASEDWPANAIVVRGDDPKFRAGQWSVLVQAVEDSDFYISLVQKTEWTLGAPLKETIPHVSRVPTGDSILFVYYLPYDPSGVIKEDWILNVNTMIGDIDVFIGQDPMHVPPTKDHHEFASYGPNDRVMILKSSKLEPGPLFISVQGSSTEEDIPDSIFELTISSHDASRYLPVDQPQQFVSGVKDTHYHVLPPMLDKGEQQVTVVVESCDTLPVPNLYGSAVNKKPSPKTNFTSQGVPQNNDMRQVLTDKIPAGDKNANRAFYITVEGVIPGARPTSQLYSLSTTFQGEVPRPNIPSGKDRYWAVAASTPEKMKVELYKSEAPPRFSNVGLQYDVYLVAVNDTLPAEEVNMHTACGVQLFGKRVASVKEITPMDSTDTISVEFEVDQDKTYMMNVLVHNGFGVYNVYHQSWIINGRFFEDYPSSFLAFFSPLSVGFFLLLIGFIGVVLYLIIGVAVQAARGKRGVEMIPNYYFWKDLPYLILDGVRLIGSICVRRSKQYAAFTDEPDTVNTTGFDTAAVEHGGYADEYIDQYGVGAIEDEEERPAQSYSVDGYGAI